MNRLNIIYNDKNIEDMVKEDVEAMAVILKLPSDEQAWEQQQRKQKVRYLSASMTFGQHDKVKNICTRCGDSSGSHSAVDCPWSNARLLAG